MRIPVPRGGSPSIWHGSAMRRSLNNLDSGALGRLATANSALVERAFARHRVTELTLGARERVDDRRLLPRGKESVDRQQRRDLCRCAGRQPTSKLHRVWTMKSFPGRAEASRHASQSAPETAVGGDLRSGGRPRQMPSRDAVKPALRRSAAASGSALTNIASKWGRSAANSSRITRQRGPLCAAE